MAEGRYVSSGPLRKANLWPQANLWPVYHVAQARLPPSNAIYRLGELSQTLLFLPDDTGAIAKIREGNHE